MSAPIFGWLNVEGSPEVQHISHAASSSTSTSSSFSSTSTSSSSTSDPSSVAHVIKKRWCVLLGSHLVLAGQNKDLAHPKCVINLCGVFVQHHQLEEISLEGETGGINRARCMIKLPEENQQNSHSFINSFVLVIPKKTNQLKQTHSSAQSISPIKEGTNVSHITPNNTSNHGNSSKFFSTFSQTSHIIRFYAKDEDERDLWLKAIQLTIVKYTKVIMAYKGRMVHDLEDALAIQTNQVLLRNFVLSEKAKFQHKKDTLKIKAIQLKDSIHELKKQKKELTKAVLSLQTEYSSILAADSSFVKHKEELQQLRKKEEDIVVSQHKISQFALSTVDDINSCDPNRFYDDEDAEEDDDDDDVDELAEHDEVDGGESSSARRVGRRIQPNSHKSVLTQDDQTLLSGTSMPNASSILHHSAASYHSSTVQHSISSSFTPNQPRRISHLSSHTFSNIHTVPASTSFSTSSSSSSSYLNTNTTRYSHNQYNQNTMSPSSAGGRSILSSSLTMPKSQSSLLQPSSSFQSTQLNNNNHPVTNTLTIVESEQRLNSIAESIEQFRQDYLSHYNLSSDFSQPPLTSAMTPTVDVSLDATDNDDLPTDEQILSGSVPTRNHHILQQKLSMQKPEIHELYMLVLDWLTSLKEISQQRNILIRQIEEWNKAKVDKLLQSM